MKAVWNGTVLAESNETIVVEGTTTSLRRASTSVTCSRARCALCASGGIASYYTVEAGDERNRNAAWTYGHPFPGIRKIRDHVAFWKGVEAEP